MDDGIDGLMDNETSLLRPARNHSSHRPAIETGTQPGISTLSTYSHRLVRLLRLCPASCSRRDSSGPDRFVCTSRLVACRPRHERLLRNPRLVPLLLLLRPSVRDRSQPAASKSFRDPSRSKKNDCPFTARIYSTRSIWDKSSRVATKSSPSLATARPQRRG